MKKSNRIYVIGDGDNIGEHVEYLLLNDRLEKLRNFSRSITETMITIQKIATEKMRAEIIYIGGDDILFKIDN